MHAHTTLVSAEPDETRIAQRWFCPPCGAVYDPEAGDPDAGIPAGTDFADLPHAWRCPVCESRKCDYVPLDRVRITDGGARG
jgi:rubredoxin